MIFRTCVAVAVALTAPHAVAQRTSPALLRDVNTAPPALPLGSDPFEWTPFAGRLWFVATDPIAGRELHASDGTPAGTGVVADITPGPDAATWRLAAASDRLFFTVDDGLRSGLWAVDATPGATPRLVLPLGGGRLESAPSDTTALGTRVFFAASDGVHGTEIWVSDGTAAGTRMVLDVEPSWRGSEPRGLTPLGGRMFFAAATTASGREPWITDGTAAGTLLLADTVPGPLPYDNIIPVSEPVNGRLLFFCAGGLWATDGTPQGTSQLVAGLAWDVHAVQRSARLGGFVYFPARTSATQRGLWRSDGTPAGTGCFVATGSTSAVPVGSVGGRLVYQTTRLWSTDGTAAGIRPVGGVAVRYAYPGPVLGGRLLMTGSANAIGVFWTDGYTAGQIASGFGAIGGMGPAFGGAAWFNADDSTGAGAEPWVTDGTAVGTAMFKDLARWPPGATRSSDPREVTAWGEQLAFLAAAAGAHTLWVSDGTTAGTVPGPGFPGSAPFGQREGRLASRADALFALTDDPAGGAGLLLFADRGAGPVLLATLTGSWWNFEQVGYRDGVAVTDVDLIVSDGSVAGTARVPINPGGPSFASSPTVVGSALFVLASDGSNTGLWRVDGASVTPIGPPGFWGQKLAAGDGFLFFESGEGGFGEEPWVSDGTTAGTRLLFDIHPGAAGSSPEVLCRIAELLLFTAADPLRGMELWATDGTVAGTFPLPEVVPGPGSPMFGGAVALHDRCLLVADEPTRGDELWVLDGSGLRCLDLNPGAPSSSPRLLERVGDEVWLVADVPGVGRGLFRSDGTAAGTVPVARLDREPRLVALRNGRVWVDLDGLQHGRELWWFDSGAVVEQVGHACGEGLGLPWLDGGAPVLGRNWSVRGGGGEAGMPGLVVLGAIAPRPQRIAGWCWSVLDPTTAMVARSIADSGSPWSWSVVLPNSPSLAGLTVAIQTWHASSAGLATSPGLRAVLR